MIRFGDECTVVMGALGNNQEREREREKERKRERSRESVYMYKCVKEMKMFKNVFISRL